MGKPAHFTSFSSQEANVFRGITFRGITFRGITALGHGSKLRFLMFLFTLEAEESVMYRPVLILVVLLGTTCGIGGWSSSTASAETKAPRNREAAEKVVEALRHGIEGEDSERYRLLDSALELDENHSAAWWHSGFVRLYHQWLRYDEVAAFAEKDVRLTAYRRVRSEHPQTVEGQLALAQWCAKKKLADRQRAHLTMVLQLEPDHEQARRLLGFRRIDGDWVSREEIEQARLAVVETTAAIKRWVPELTELGNALGHRSPKKRNLAAERLRAIESAPCGL